MADKSETGLNALVLITRLEGVLYPIGQAADQLSDLIERDPALAPEIGCIRVALAEATDAISRATDFVNARYDVAKDAA